jgi:hypothetical protein
VWADNETDIDLLGFDFLVDALVVALTEPRLLPLTVGVLGDWGSGKSSLMRIVRQELETIGGPDDPDRRRYVCVRFSPWQYEDYDDVKVALMSAVLDRLQPEIEPEEQDRVSGLRQFVRGLRRRTRWLGRAAIKTVPAGTAVAAHTLDPTMDATTRGLVQAGAAAVAAEADRLFAEPPAAKDGPPAAGAGDPVEEVGTFRTEFEDLVAKLDRVAAIVVFIDDLDRCLPETVVDTFEAIRLFLNTPKTAYVVAANQQVVESAIDSRYPELRRQDGTGVGADYLEKMLQLKVAIPTLSVPEAETYMNLLLAELRLDDEPFKKVRAEVRRRRAENSLMVAFNLGVAGDILGDVPPDLARDLERAARIAPVLGAGLRGNPRQLKRFLNNLLLKERSAARRGVDLDLEVLAKLMVLEDQHVGDFQRLFDWQLTAAGSIPELAAAEAAVQPGPRSEGLDVDGEQAAAEPAGLARGPRPAAGASNAGAAAGSSRKRRASGPALPDEVAAWAAKPHVRAWLALPPRLGGVDLRPYFTYSRDKLSLGVVISRLPPHLQELVVQAESEVDRVRRATLDRVAELEEAERELVVSGLLERLIRHPAGPAFAAAAELAERVPETAAAVCEAMIKIPPAAVPPERVLTVVRRLPTGHPAVEGLLDRWQASGVAGLEQVAATARQAAARSTRPRSG